MTRLFIDTHVHIYPEYDISHLLNSALRNFKIASAGIQDCDFVLALTERFDCNFFKTHKEAKWHGKWELKFNPAQNLICAQKLNDKIYLLAGRQNISAEKLEVLTLGSDDFRAEGLPAIEVIKGSQETGLVTILPWSFGKWWGSRGKLVQKLIQDSTLNFAIGDPAHRFGLRPKLFNHALNSSRKLLCGTDPLPLSGEDSRIGAYGSVFKIEDGELTHTKIIQALKSAPSNYGKKLDLITAIWLQARLRFPN